MNEEEKKAIEILDTFELRRKTKNYKEISLEDTQSVKVVLNLIEKLQNMIKKRDKQIEQYQNILVTNDLLHVKESQEKDKIIDLMTEYIEYITDEIDYEGFCDENKNNGNIIFCDEDCKECIKQHFEKKAKET